MIQLTPAYFLPEQLKPGARTEWVLAKGIFLGVATGTAIKWSSYAEETEMYDIAWRELIPMWKLLCWRTGCAQQIPSSRIKDTWWSLHRIQQGQQWVSLPPGPGLLTCLNNPLDPLCPLQSRKKNPTCFKDNLTDWEYCYQCGKLPGRNITFLIYLKILFQQHFRL